MASLSTRDSLRPGRVTAALLSGLLHLGMLALIVLAGGPADGLIERAAESRAQTWLTAPIARQRDFDLPDPPVAAIPQVQADAGPAPATVDPPGERLPPPPLPEPDLAIPDLAAAGPLATRVEDPAEDPARPVDLPPAFMMGERQASSLTERLEQFAEALLDREHASVSWAQDGWVYEAELAREPTRDGVELERAVAVVSAEHQGRRLHTFISLKRLPFSHYAKVIDRWDPMVQLHDDVVVGRMHVNSRFNLLQDAEAAPRLLGRVSTAAGGYNLERDGRRQDREIFAEGVATRVGRIDFAGGSWSLAQARPEDNARIHEFAGDTQLRFLGEEGYAWRERKSDGWQRASRPGGQPVYFTAARGATLSVQGVVSGRFLVHSPGRIVVTGGLTYARDPRRHPDSDDFLGLVSDRDIEIAPPGVTGPGDLEIHAALFARRRIVVTSADRPGRATLLVLGSVAAGSLTESEPRFATRVEHDSRLDRVRPPGFPSTNRFAMEDWDRRWTEVPAHAATDGL